jgi:hypothetical protein
LSIFVLISPKFITIPSVLPSNIISHSLYVCCIRYRVRSSLILPWSWNFPSCWFCMTRQVSGCDPIFHCVAKVRWFGGKVECTLHQICGIFHISGLTFLSSLKNGFQHISTKWNSLYLKPVSHL